MEELYLLRDGAAEAPDPTVLSNPEYREIPLRANALCLQALAERSASSRVADYQENRSSGEHTQCSDSGALPRCCQYDGHEVKSGNINGLPNREWQRNDYGLRDATRLWR
jgi:hypothetical protein